MVKPTATQKSKRKLRYEIATLLIIKLCLLGLLWALCFSHPIEKQINADAMYYHLASLREVL